jgi:hypothetical protein
VNTAEGPYVGAKRGTRSLTGMAMHFALAISVIVPRPFVDPMADRRMGWMTPPVALPCIGVQLGAASRKVCNDELVTRPPVRVVAHPEALLPWSAGHNAEEGGRSLADVRWPLRVWARRRGGSLGSRGGVLFFPGVRVECIGLKGGTGHHVDWRGGVQVGLHALTHRVQLLA